MGRVIVHDGYPSRKPWAADIPVQTLTHEIFCNLVANFIKSGVGEVF
jgi:hypothetical protein